MTTNNKLTTTDQAIIGAIGGSNTVLDLCTALLHRLTKEERKALIEDIGLTNSWEENIRIYEEIVQAHQLDNQKEG